MTTTARMRKDVAQVAVQCVLDAFKTHFILNDEESINLDEKISTPKQRGIPPKDISPRTRT